MDSKNFSKNLLELMQFPTEGIFSTVIAKGETFNYTLMCLAKGTDIDTHTSTKNGIIYVVKGTGEFMLYDEKIDMKPGISIVMPADAPHALKAHEDLAILLCLHM